MTIEEFIDGLTAQFGAPKTEDLPSFLQEWNRLMEGYLPEQIQHAFDETVKNQTYKAWPTYAEVRQRLMAWTPPQQGVERSKEYDAGYYRRLVLSLPPNHKHAFGVTRDQVLAAMDHMERAERAITENWEPPTPEAKVRVQALVDEFKENMAEWRLRNERAFGKNH